MDKHLKIDFQNHEKIPDAISNATEYFSHLCVRRQISTGSVLTSLD